MGGGFEMGLLKSESSSYITCSIIRTGDGATELACRGGGSDGTLKVLSLGEKKHRLFF